MRDFAVCSVVSRKRWKRLTGETTEDNIPVRVFKRECMSVCVCSLNIGCVFPFDRMVEGMKCINIDEANYFTLEN